MYPIDVFFLICEYIEKTNHNFGNIILCLNSYKIREEQINKLNDIFPHQMDRYLFYEYCDLDFFPQCKQNDQS